MNRNFIDFFWGGLVLFGSILDLQAIQILTEHNFQKHYVSNNNNREKTQIHLF